MPDLPLVPSLENLITPTVSEYFREIADQMAARWPQEFAEFVQMVNAAWSDDA